MRTCLLPLLLIATAGHSLANVAITTISVPNGTVDTSYSATIQAKGGCTPYSWSVSGTLPAGITRKASTTSLKLYGTPTTAESASFTVAVKGCGGYISKKSYKLTIQKTAEHIVDLKWNASTSLSVAGYNVYRSSDGTTWKKANASLIGSTQYTDSTVSNGSTYYYASTAVAIDGYESKRSASVKVVVP